MKDDSLYCRICGEIRWSSYHQCLPRWQYRLDGSDGEWKNVYAGQDERAAEKAAKKEWDFESGDEMRIWLRKPDELMATLYVVDIESEPVFNCRHAYRGDERKVAQLKAEAEEE